MIFNGTIQSKLLQQLIQLRSLV